MQINKKKTAIAVIVICVLACLSILGAWNILKSSSRQMDQELFKTNADNIADTYAEVCYRFQENVQARWNYLEDIDFILRSTDQKKFSTVNTYMEQIRSERNFTGFYMVDENGNYRTLDGSSGYLDLGNGLFSLTDDRESVIVDGSLPTIQKVMFYAIPVEPNTIDDFEYCILVLGYTVEDRAALFSVSAYNGQSNAFIVYTNGRVCTSAGNNTLSVSNVISYLKDNGADEDTVSSVTDDLKTGTENTLLVTLEEKTCYLHYQSLGIQDWIMLSLTPEEAINASTDEVRSITSRSLIFAFGSIGIVIGLILVGFLIWTVRKGQSEVAKRDRMFELLSLNTTDAYVMLSLPKLKAEYVSPNITRLFGLDAKEVYLDHKKLGDVIFSGFPFTDEELRKLRAGEEISFDADVKKAEAGAVRPDSTAALHFRIIAQRPAGENSSSLIIIMKDRTRDEEASRRVQSANEELSASNEELVAVNEELSAVNEELNTVNDQLNAARSEADKARQSAESANQAKTSFLFNMSHDIRTPMNAIIGYTDLLGKHREDSEKMDDYLSKIHSSSDFLLSLINNVLEMARIESGKVVLDEAPASGSKVFDEIANVYAELMNQKGITFTVSKKLQTVYLYLDEVKLNEIYLNIVSNAYKYTLEGGSVSFEVEELPSDQEGFVLIKTIVADTGIGMSKEYLPTIFEEFSRAQTQTDSKIQGTGLGMPIVKRLIDLMGGTIEVESELGKGTAFTIIIPHRIAEKPAEEAVKENIDYASFAGKRILLAEDNDLNAEIAEEILAEYDFKIERAQDGIICVDMLSRAKAGYYDLILMDIQMPNLDGYGAARRIRSMSDPEKADIPIIAMTANAFDEDKHNALDAGMDGHIAKPIDIPALMETLAGVFTNRSAVKQLVAAPKAKKDPVAHVKRIYFEMQRSKAVSVLPGGFFAYMAEQPEKLIFANELCCSIWGCSNFEEFNELVGGSFKGIVHPDDYERVEKEIWHQIDNGDTGLDQVKYRTIRKDGSVANIADYGRLVRDEKVGDIFYVFVAETHM